MPASRHRSHEPVSGGFVMWSGIMIFLLSRELPGPRAALDLAENLLPRPEDDGAVRLHLAGAGASRRSLAIEVDSPTLTRLRRTAIVRPIIGKILLS